MVTINPASPGLTGYKVKLINTEGKYAKISYAKDLGKHLVIDSMYGMKGSAIVQHMGN